MRLSSALALTGILVCSHVQAGLAQQASLPLQSSTNTVIPSAPGQIVYPSFSIESGTACPVPAFNVQGFGGNVNNSTSYPDRYSGSGNYGNYGVAAGILMPLGGGLMNYCKKAAAAKAQKAELDTWTTLINNCAELVSKGVQFESMPGLPEEFKKCKYVIVPKVASGSKGSNSFLDPGRGSLGLTLERFSPPQGGTLQLVP
jgi:hypothetical protein